MGRVNNEHREKCANAEPDKYRFEHIDFEGPIKFSSGHSQTLFRNTDPLQRKFNFIKNSDNNH